MNAERLLKLADFLDKLPKEKFDFSVIAREGEKPFQEALEAGKHRCGTVACAMGWMPAKGLFDDLVEWAPSRRNQVWPVKWSHEVRLKDRPEVADFDAVEEVFDLTEDEAQYLFVPDHEASGKDGPFDPAAPSKEATPADVAAHIRRFVKNNA